MIFDNFWGYLPPEGVDGIGFGLFTKAHFTWLLILAVLIAFFAADMIYSRIHPNVGTGITDYNTSSAVSEESSSQTTSK